MKTKEVSNIIHIFRKTLLPYGDELIPWLDSESCCFRNPEKELIKACCEAKSVKEVATKLKLSEGFTLIKIKRMRFRLERNLEEFKEWQLENFKIRTGYKKEPDENETLLTADFAFHNFSPKLYYNLSSSLEDNLNGILTNYTEENLLSLRGFGKKSLEELKIYLEAKGLLHLLKRNKNKETEKQVIIPVLTVSH